jgi:anaerobilin synthase
VQVDHIVEHGLFKKRYRSHHDAQHAIAMLLGTTGRPGHGPGHGSALDMGGPPDFDKLLKKRKPHGPAALYLHVPFCDRLCTFCNLNRKGLAEEKHSVINLLDDYVQLLVRQLDLCSGTDYSEAAEIQAVYFGGGTPTVLSARQFREILTQMKKVFRLNPLCEITVESTLHNMSDDLVSLLVDEGVNRLSIGVQTFSDGGRKLLGRSGNGSWAEERLSRIRDKFPGVLSIDLIYTYPGQQNVEIESDVLRAIQSSVDSVSFYSLMLQENSPLDRMVREGEIDFDRTLDTERRGHDRMLSLFFKQGFELRELSKVIRPGDDSYRYIDLMYGQGEVLPFGTGAGGMISGLALMRPSGNVLITVPRSGPEEAANRILGILQRGVYEKDILVSDFEIIAESQKRLGGSVSSAIDERLAFYKTSGFISDTEGGAYRLTPDGVFWGNNIAVDFLQYVTKL